MTTIKAAICREFGANLSVEDVTLAAPQGSEIEVTLKACAICHSDITYAEGGWGGTLPAVFGHEAAGHITAKGDSVRSLSVGDPVVVVVGGRGDSGDDAEQVLAVERASEEALREEDVAVDEGEGADR